MLVTNAEPELNPFSKWRRWNFNSPHCSRTKKYCKFAADTGHNPFAPHLFYTQFLDDSQPHERKLGMELGMIMLTKCAEMWVFGEVISPGMEREIAKAEARAMRIRYFTSDCQEVRT